MSSIHFHRRYEADGRCTVICMHCFQTLGTAWDRSSVEEMETSHLCEFWRQGAPAAPSEIPAKKSSPAARLPQLLEIPVGLLALLTVLGLYGVPTALELAARHALNPWLAVIVPGNVIGCAVLAGLLRRPRTGVLLYLLLMALEGLSYVSGAVRAHQLVWFADLVPTVAVLTRLLRMRLRALRLPVS